MRILIKLLIVFVSSFVLSCNNREEEKEYYPSRNIKSLKVYNQKNDKLEQTIYYYDTTGDKKIKVFYHKKNYDSLVYYYDNGKIFKTGKQDLKHNLYGKWDYYNKDGFLSDTKEYFVINNKLYHGSVLNQQWYYNQKGDTMFYGNNKFNIYQQKEFEYEGEKTSRFIRFNFYPARDTLSIAEPFKCFAEDGYPTFGLSNSESYVVLAKEKFNFKSDFSNEAKVKLDTFFCLAKDKVNGNEFSNVDKMHTVAFGRWFDTPGNKILRGYMVEYYTRKPTSDNKAVKYEKTVYFEKRIYVKDTLK